MIRYTLRCAEGHDFESWFQSAAAFDTLAGAGHLSCPVCGTSQVNKAVMAPQVRPARSAAAPEAPGNAPADAAPNAPEADKPPITAPASALEARLAALRKHVEETSEYVGQSFVDEARRMHSGEAPERSIHGEARLEEARALIEEGVPIAPLPFLPARKTN